MQNYEIIVTCVLVVIPCEYFFALFTRASWVESSSGSWGSWQIIVSVSKVGTWTSSSEAVEARGDRDAACCRLAHRSSHSPHPNVSPCACFENINHPLQQERSSGFHNVFYYTDHTVFLNIYAFIPLYICVYSL